MARYKHIDTSPTIFSRLQKSSENSLRGQNNHSFAFPHRPTSAVLLDTALHNFCA